MVAAASCPARGAARRRLFGQRISDAGRDAPQMRDPGLSRQATGVPGLRSSAEPALGRVTAQTRGCCSAPGTRGGRHFTRWYSLTTASAPLRPRPFVPIWTGAYDYAPDRLKRGTTLTVAGDMIVNVVANFAYDGLRRGYRYTRAAVRADR
jgi:hypothetical protein